MNYLRVFKKMECATKQCTREKPTISTKIPWPIRGCGSITRSILNSNRHPFSFCSAGVKSIGCKIF